MTDEERRAKQAATMGAYRARKRAEQPPKEKPPPKPAEQLRAEKTAYNRAYWAANRDQLIKYNREQYRAKREERLAYMREWYAQNADHAKAADKARRDADPEARRAYKRARNAANPEAHRAEVKAWAKANPEKRKALAKAGQHNRRARKRAGGKMTAADIRALHEMADGICAYCLQPSDRLHVEHCTPLCRGGTNTPDNCVMACPDCNFRKGSKTVLEFMCNLPRLGTQEKASDTPRLGASVPE